MPKYSCLLAILLINFCFASNKYPCFEMNDESLIRIYIDSYEEEARKHLLEDLPPYREKWEAQYFDQFKNLKSAMRFSLRYPDVYHNILLFDQRLALMKDFWFEYYYRLYMSTGWAYNQQEKEERISQQRKRIGENFNNCRGELYDCSSKITSLYVTGFEKCLKNNKASVAVYLDYGLLAYLNNNFDKSLDLLSKMINLAQKTGEIDQLDSEAYCQLGAVCLEAMHYDMAIKYLSESIKKDPHNKEAYFARAAAYFETGNFDEAIKDYLSSDKGKGIVKSATIASDAFTEALIKSACNGALESFVDFVPSLCNSIYGLRKTIWAAHPINAEAMDNIKNFANTCYEITGCVANYCKNIDGEKIDSLVDEIKILYMQFDRLSEKEKGELVGYAVGKYGIDILIGAAEIKGLQIINNTVPLFRNFKNANQICNFDTMCLSQADKEAVIASSLQHAVEREAYFKNVKIHWGKQNKHIPGKHNFESGRGTILIEESELQDLLKKYIGTGDRIIGEMFEANYRERVDFRKIIGEYAREVKGKPIEYVPTSKGIIHYDKNGNYHVVPSDPAAIMD